MNTFELSKRWFRYCYEQPGARPHHTALYFWIVDRANRSGWKDLVDLPTDFSMQSTGIGSYVTYRKALTQLHEWGFITWAVKARNQHYCNKVQLSAAPPISAEAAATAAQQPMPQHTHSTAGIYKPEENNTKPQNPQTLTNGPKARAGEGFGSGFDKNISVDKKEDTAPAEKENATQPIAGQPFKKEKKKGARAKKEKATAGAAQPELLMPFAGQAFAHAWQQWLQYRAQRRLLCSHAHKQTMLHHLQSLSQGQQEAAVAIIQQSIVQGWNGLFAPRQAALPHNKIRQQDAKYSKARAYAAALEVCGLS